jgi:GNAT superfamily N-acetyltransferase
MNFAGYNLRADQTGCQIGFARVVSDGARIAWLSDVFVLASERGQGLGTWLVGTAMADPR